MNFWEEREETYFSSIPYLASSAGSGINLLEPLVCSHKHSMGSGFSKRN